MSTYEPKRTALFVPCTLDGYSQYTGSINIRARWVAKYWPGAAVYDGRQSLAGWELVVFQKAYLSAHSRSLIGGLAERRDEGGEKRPLLALDLCDPDFLSETHRQRLLDVLPAFDFAAAPTPPLVEWLSQYLPTYLIPDTYDPEAITWYHGLEWRAAPRKAVWIGYQANREALSPVLLSTVHKLGLELEILELNASLPFELFLQQLTQYDILLNPRPEWGKYRYKSNNKSLIAWAAGVAVAETEEDLHALTNPEWHAEWIRLRLKELQLEQQHAPFAVAAWQAAYKAVAEVVDEGFSC